jgi:hypothetical protein
VVIGVRLQSQELKRLRLHQFEWAGADRPWIAPDPVTLHLAALAHDVELVFRQNGGDADAPEEEGGRPRQHETDGAIVQDLKSLNLFGLLRKVILEADQVEELTEIDRRDEVPVQDGQEGCLDVVGRERLAVMPAHALAQVEGVLEPVRGRFPVGGEVRVPRLVQNVVVDQPIVDEPPGGPVAVVAVVIRRRGPNLVEQPQANLDALLARVIALLLGATDGEDDEKKKNPQHRHTAAATPGALTVLDRI